MSCFHETDSTLLFFKEPLISLIRFPVILEALQQCLQVDIYIADSGDVYIYISALELCLSGR